MSRRMCDGFGYSQCFSQPHLKSRSRFDARQISRREIEKARKMSNRPGCADRQSTDNVWLLRDKLHIEGGIEMHRIFQPCRFIAWVGFGLAGLTVMTQSAAAQDAAPASPVVPAAAQDVDNASSPSDQIPQARPTDAPQVSLASNEPAGSTCSRCCERCISYKHHKSLKRNCCGRNDTISTVLKVCDSCCGEIEIPVCLPCCCDGTPTVCTHNGILGRHSVTYKWCCGYRVKVVFDRCGNIVVHSYDR